MLSLVLNLFLVVLQISGSFSYEIALIERGLAEEERISVLYFKIWVFVIQSMPCRPWAVNPYRSSSLDPTRRLLSDTMNL